MEAVSPKAWQKDIAEKLLTRVVGDLFIGVARIFMRGRTIVKALFTDL